MCTASEVMPLKIPLDEKTTRSYAYLYVGMRVVKSYSAWRPTEARKLEWSNVCGT